MSILLIDRFHLTDNNNKMQKVLQLLLHGYMEHLVLIQV